MAIYTWWNEISGIYLWGNLVTSVYKWNTEVRSASLGPLCFTANTAGSTINITKVSSPTHISLEVSTDWNTWTAYTYGTNITLTNIWDKVYWRNPSSTMTAFSKNSSNYYKFVMTGSIKASWDVTYLLCNTGTTTLYDAQYASIRDYCFCYLFRDCTSLTEAPSLPVTTLVSSCYYGMFQGCTWLTTAPKLPATTLTTSCYYYMFNGCTWLTTAPELPATTLASSCYMYMFNGCTWLTTAPELPATTMASQCYGYMFQGCTWLTTPPELPATTMANNCYYYMFLACTWLTKAPKLSATTLANYCYSHMFMSCSNLEELPELPATEMKNYCYYYMFQNCSKIKLSSTQTWEYQTAYRLPSTGTWTSAGSWNSYMFQNTWWTFKSGPTINTTYYTSNTVVS